MQSKTTFVSIYHDYEKKIYGYVGKAKGLLQVCKERGFIDAECQDYGPRWKDYPMDVAKKDEFGNEDTKITPLRIIISQCSDFLNEKCQLAVVAEHLGAEFDLSPKCHAELAGEGIKYIWGFFKRAYRKEWTSEFVVINDGIISSI